MRLEYYVPIVLIFIFFLGFICGASTHEKLGAIAVYENRIVCEKAFDDWVCKEVIND